MTNFEKVKKYYDDFDEENRLKKDNSGKLEFDMTTRVLDKYISENKTILDLGGGTGVYTFYLAEKGHKMYLADLSEKLINQALEKKTENVISCDIVNAINLSKYSDEMFDVILLFGPLYHLLDEDERRKCIKECNRVLKQDGLIFASFIPYLSGSIAILDRYFRHPEQVNSENLKMTFENGKFRNNSENGFQEGFYPNADEIVKLFSENGFEKIALKSIRGFGYEKEDDIYKIEDKKMFDEVMDLIDKTSEESSIIEMCGHAMFIGKKI